MDNDSNDNVSLVFENIHTIFENVIDDKYL